MIGLDEAGVLRGMDIEAAPFRLRRASAKPLQEAGETASAQELAARHGYEDGLRQGQAEGLRRGYEEGSRKAREDLAAQAQAAAERAAAEAALPLRQQEQRLLALLGSIAAEERSRDEQAEDEMVALCYEAACAVIGARAVRPATVRAQLARLTALHRNGQASLVLHVHPHDAELLETLQPSAETAGARPVRWVADPQVPTGGCILVRGGVALDFRLETALERCKEVLLQARQRRAPAGERA